jgi:hypothetical protein
MVKAKQAFRPKEGSPGKGGALVPVLAGAEYPHMTRRHSCKKVRLLGGKSLICSPELNANRNKAVSTHRMDGCSPYKTVWISNVRYATSGGNRGVTSNVQVVHTEMLYCNIITLV